MPKLFSFFLISLLVFSLSFSLNGQAQEAKTDTTTQADKAATEPSKAVPLAPPTVEEAAAQEKKAAAEASTKEKESETKPSEPKSPAPSPAPAPSPPPQEASSEIKPKNPLADQDVLEIVVIGAASLNDKVKKQSKLEAIRKAVRNALKYVPRDTHISLRVSGHRYPAAEATQSCQDTELLLGPASGQASAVNKKMTALKAQGKRSLVRTVSQALADLGPYGGTKTLLVITDGLEACLDQDPVAYLAPASLKDRGYVIHIRGLAVPKDDEAALQRLAQETGGTFVNATDAFAFTQNLTIAAKWGADPEAAKAALAARPKLALTQETEQAPPAPEEAAGGPGAAHEEETAPEAAAQAPAPKAPPPPPPPPAPAFDPNKLVQEIVQGFRTHLKKGLAEQTEKIKKQKAPAPPPPKAKTFSALSLTIIIIETVLLLMAGAAIILLLIRQTRD